MVDIAPTDASYGLGSARYASTFCPFKILRLLIVIFEIETEIPHRLRITCSPTVSKIRIRHSVTVKKFSALRVSMTFYLNRFIHLKTVQLQKIMDALKIRIGCAVAVEQNSAFRIRISS